MIADFVNHGMSRIVGVSRNSRVKRDIESVFGVSRTLVIWAKRDSTVIGTD